MLGKIGEDLMKVGDLVKLHSSTRRNGSYAGKPGLIVGLDEHGNPVINIGGEVKAFHYSQIDEVINASR
jgi:hypothetical protein|tara:strand:+ start:635 stop:841 length:207 start_codon:yes stop_codon:yes gene_type:complete